MSVGIAWRHPDATADQIASSRRDTGIRICHGARKLQMRQLFLDLDGVLADFDSHYESEFGHRPNRAEPTPKWFWKRIADHGRFFRDLPVLADARELWEGAKKLHPNPIILTGLTHVASDICEAHKRAWVAEHISPDAHVIVCRSRDKRLHGKPGDILVDDWPKYQKLWEEMGGVFILHRSAAESLRKVEEVLQQGVLS